MVSIAKKTVQLYPASAVKSQKAAKEATLGVVEKWVAAELSAASQAAAEGRGQALLAKAESLAKVEVKQVVAELDIDVLVRDKEGEWRKIQEIGRTMCQTSLQISHWEKKTWMPMLLTAYQNLLSGVEEVAWDKYDCPD
jgi:hypothetical protein